MNDRVTPPADPTPEEALAWIKREAQSIIVALAPIAAPDNQTAEGDRAREVTRLLTETLEEAPDLPGSP